MRKVTFGAANSLDNFIAREDHAVDWLLWGPEAEEVMTEFWKTIDTVVMGRKTYEVAVKQGMPSYPGVKNYVLSRTLGTLDRMDKTDKTDRTNWTDGTRAGVEVVSRDAAEFMRELKSQPGNDICLMGGGELANSLFEAGLIDEIGFNIHPVLLGAGIPLYLPMKRQVDLELLECRPFKNGCVLVRYGVKH